MTDRSKSTAARCLPAVGPVWVETPEQMLAIYDNMRADPRLRFFL